MEPEETEGANYEGDTFFKPGFGVDEWEALKLQLSIDTIITGKVVHQAPFGVFIDANLGFHVLMFVAEFNDKGQALIFPDDFPALNSALSGQFAGFNEINRQIIVARPSTELHSDFSPSGAACR